MLQMSRAFSETNVFDIADILGREMDFSDGLRWDKSIVLVGIECQAKICLHKMADL